MSGFDKFKVWVKDLFKDDPGPEPEPPGPPVAPQEKPTPPGPPYFVMRHVETDAGRWVDLVVDFGTSATVIAAVRATPGVRVVHCLVGKTEFSSKVAIAMSGTNGKPPDVIGVGDKALGAFNTATGKRHLYHSLKRYIELLSRQAASADALRMQSHIVGEYIKKAMDQTPEGKRATEKAKGDSRVCPVQRQSHVVLSVPNNFNGAAVTAVRRGVHQALVSLFGDENVPALEDLHVVREGEAAAHCFWRTLEGEVIEVEGQPVTLRKESWRALTGAMPGTEQIKRFGILDVGAGTTDLTVLDVIAGENGQGRLRVALNAGVPIGGVDVDYRLLSATIQDAMRTLPKAEPKTREVALAGVGDRKKTHGVRQTAQTQGFFVEQEWESFKTKVEIEGPSGLQVVSDREAAEEKAKRGVDAIVGISVPALLGFVTANSPTAKARPLDALVLTGRGSMLQEIRTAVERWSATTKVPIVTLAEGLDYELKCVVAFGCALIPTSHVKSNMPAGRLGRELNVAIGPTAAIATLHSDAEVPGDVPQVWQVVTPRPSERAEWWLTESRVKWDGTYLDGVAGETLDVLGLVRVATQWTSTPRGGGAEQLDVIRIVRDPGADTYYVSSKGEWKSIPGFDADRRRGENPLTGLPFTFGDDIGLTGDKKDASQ